MSDSEKTPESPRMRRSSRYQRAQERREAQKRSDNRFYGGIFALIGIVVMFSILIAAVSINGASVDVSGLQGWTSPWVFGLSRLEICGLIVVAFIAVIMYLRIRKR